MIKLIKMADTFWYKSKIPSHSLWSLHERQSWKYKEKSMCTVCTHKQTAHCWTF